VRHYFNGLDFRLAFFLQKSCNHGELSLFDVVRSP